MPLHLQGIRHCEYSDLKSLTPQPDTRPAERELEVRLGGNMERYIWTINGKKFTEVEAVTGEIWRTYPAEIYQ